MIYLLVLIVVLTEKKDELALNKSVKGNYYVRIMLKDIFGFAEHQEKATYGLCYKLNLTRHKEEAVIDKVAGIAYARIKIDHIHWYVPHYTPSMSQQGLISKQILKEKHPQSSDMLNDLFS